MHGQALEAAMRSLIKPAEAPSHFLVFIISYISVMAFPIKTALCMEGKHC